MVFFSILTNVIPSTLVPCKGFVKAIPISVIPYRSSRKCPDILCHFFKTGTGSAAEPETINLKKLDSI